MDNLEPNLKNPKSAANETDETKSETDIKKNAAKPKLSQDEKKILSVMRKDSRTTQKKIHEETGISLGTIKQLDEREDTY